MKKLGLIILLLIATAPHFVMPVGYMLGYDMPTYTAMLGLLGMLLSTALFLAYAIITHKPE